MSALHDLELKISKLLRFGVLLAGSFLFVGWVGLLIQHGEHLHEFVKYEPQTLLSSLSSADFFSWVAYIGLILLVLLPIIRVLLTAVLFVRQQDRGLALMAFLVFASLVASLFLGVEL